MATTYLDSSALVKLVVVEAESSALRRYLRGTERQVSSYLAIVEVMRAVRHLGPAAIRQAGEILRRIALISIDESLLNQAASLDPPNIRTLDAIHLVTALSLGAELSEVVTYDSRMARAAGGLGLDVAAPKIAM